MKKSVIDKHLLFENMKCDNPAPRYIKRWLRNAEFEMDKNMALVNDNKKIWCFQNDNPVEQSEDWEDQFIDFCDLLVEQFFEWKPEFDVVVKKVLEETFKGDGRIFCGCLEVVNEVLDAE